MTSVLSFSPWLANNTAAHEYAAVSSTSPEADATFIESFSYHPNDRTVLSESSRGSKHKSKSSYSNADFDGSQRKMTTSERTWNDTAFDVGRWTTLAAGTVASSILSTTQHISSQLQSSNIATATCSPTGPKVTFQAQDAHHPKAFGRGIDRDYLQGSPHHPSIEQRSFVGYLGDLAARFTAPKIETGKAKWID